MATRSLTIRGIPDAVLARLRARASARHRSLNGEVLAILTQAAEAESAGEPTPAVREPAAAYAGATRGEAAASAASEIPGLGASLLDSVDRDMLSRACRQHHIRWLAVFGSHARGDARANSDVDVVVEFEPGRTPGLGLIRVAEALSPVFGGRRVDLVTRRGLPPRLRDRILAEAEVLHGA
jgi:uncharacterized protein